jgi:hypothetical protein
LDETTTSLSRVEGSRKGQQVHFQSSSLPAKLHGITLQNSHLQGILKKFKSKYNLHRDKQTVLLSSQFTKAKEVYMHHLLHTPTFLEVP